MGCVGLDLAGSEYAVSICAKDSGGPYDYELTNRFIALAKKHELPYTVDIFPFYGSDVGAAARLQGRAHRQRRLCEPRHGAHTRKGA